MSFRIVDEPPDRSEFIKEALGVISGRIRQERTRLLARVAAADDATFGAGADDDWGLGQVALHLLTVERGISGIALRLARGEPPGPTGQPRPVAGSATRDGLASLAAKAEERLEKLIAEFPGDPNMKATARQPYYGEMNCIGWLLAVPLHYAAHLEALERGTKSAL
ncbi:MAG: hypothetical protein HYU87_06975 [Chloroflexi bacterium]|nr:hypothetical protein [Chloroflexota bacterium]